eukprot:360207-Chlamydomonas_euryale.AAC.7
MPVAAHAARPARCRPHARDPSPSRHKAGRAHEDRPQGWDGGRGGGSERGGPAHQLRARR